MKNTPAFGGHARLHLTRLPPGFLPKLTGLAGFAAEELLRGFAACFNITPGDGGDYTLTLSLDPALGAEAYELVGSPAALAVNGGCERGLLYGVYNLLERLQRDEPVETMKIHTVPAVPHRVVRHTGDAAALFANTPPEEMEEYARLLASIGINEITVAMPCLRPDVAAVFRPFGITLIADLHDEDKPLAYYAAQADALYADIPDLAGFFVHAASGDSEKANAIARALAAYGGTLYRRCSVNYSQNWRDTAADRAKAPYETFRNGDGTYAPNVLLLTPHSPVDAYIHAPNSPLLGAITQTQQGIEFTLTHENLDPARDLYAAAPQWEEILDTPVTDACMTRGLIGHEVTAMVAVASAGESAHFLSRANLYAFGRMAWDPAHTAETLMRDWAVLTFGSAPEVVEPVVSMLLDSRTVYAKYTTPPGLGGMTDPRYAYAPAPDILEYTPHGVYHRATATHVGIDRTTHGTEYSAQYHYYVRDRYEDIKACPEKYLLFFHRLPYTHKLKSGTTLIQHIYNNHFEGVMDVQRFITLWEGLHKKIPPDIFTTVRDQLEAQLESAKEWRDAVNSYFYRLTGIPDAKGRKIYT